jgi:hypothetical protein
MILGDAIELFLPFAHFQTSPLVNESFFGFSFEKPQVKGIVSIEFIVSWLGNFLPVYQSMWSVHKRLLRDSALVHQNQVPHCDPLERSLSSP